MSEREVWQKMIELWSGPLNSDGESYILSSGHRCYGLCHVISNLYNYKFIEREIRVIMLEKIEEEKSRLDKVAYCWPLNEDGAKSRVEFCERMITQC